MLIMVTIVHLKSRLSMSRNRVTIKIMVIIIIHKIHRFFHNNFLVVKTAQFPAVHQPPQETSVEILHDHENVTNSVQTFLRKFNRYFFFETPKVLLLAWDIVSKIKDAFGNKKYKQEDIQKLFRKLFNDVQNIHEELVEYINTLSWNRPIVYYDDDDDEDYTIAITPVLSTEEPIDSLIMKDDHLDTISATESDEVIKSSVEDLFLIRSESEGIPDNMCDVPFRDNSPPLDISKEQFEDFSDSNDDSPSIDDDSFSIDEINYVEASPPHFELVSLEEVKDFHPEDRELEDDSPTHVEDGHSFLEKFKTTPKLETFKSDIEEKNSGSTTIHADVSLPNLECFYFKSEPDPGDLTSIIDPGIRENVSSTTNVNLSVEDDQSPLFTYV
nr:hypothetical protein [Tanacetum cinerariifolium]